MLTTGDQPRTLTGRLTSPFPKIDLTTPRKTDATLKRVEVWLQQKAVSEAEFKKDRMNARGFGHETPGKMPPASKDAMHLYLFGTTH